MSRNRNKNKNRVALVSLHADPLEKLGTSFAGGQNVYVKYLAEYLGKIGWKIDVFSRLNNPKKKEIETFARNVRVIRLKGGPSAFLEKDKIYDRATEIINNFIAFQKKEGIEYQLLHGNYWLSGFVCLKLKKILKIPAVETFHSLGYVRYKTLSIYKKELIDSPLVKRRLRVERNIMKNFDKIIATSPYEKQDMFEYYHINPRRVVIIPCGADSQVFKKISKTKARKYLGYSPNWNILLYVGRLEWRKGIGTLLFALHYVLTELDQGQDFLKNLKLIIVGGSSSDEELQRLKKIVAELNIKRHVKFLGSKPQEKLSYYYSAADITITPSYYEPFGLVPIESAICATPVIASRVGGLQYGVKENITGLLFIPRSPYDLAQKIVFLLKHEKTRRNMGKSGRKRVLYLFDWRKIASQMSNLYKDIIKK